MKKYHKEKQSFWIFLVIVIYVVAMYGGTIFFIQNISKTLQGEIIRNLSEVSFQNVNVLKAKIERDKNTVATVAEIAEEFDNVNDPQVAMYIEKMETINPNVKIYVADSKGAGVDKNGDEFNIFSKGYFVDSSNTIEETVFVTDQTYFAPLDNAVIYFRSVNKRTYFRMGIVMGVFPIDVYDTYIQTEMFDGEGYSYLVKSTGEAVSAKYRPESGVEISSTLGFSESNSFKSIPELQSLPEEFAKGNSGVIDYTINNQKKYLCYNSVGINDWYLLSIVPADIADKSVNNISVWAFMIGTIAIVGFTAFFIWTIFYRSKKRKEILRYAYEDILTGVNNWTYMLKYSKQLLMGNNSYAFVIFDINRFKLINDIYGYSYGDTLLQNVAKTINKNLEKDEIITRISGDIFAMLVKINSEFELTGRLEDLFKEICNNERDKIDQNTTYKLTFSCGVCQIEDKNLTITAAMDRANMAKNIAKGYYLGNIAFYNEKIKRNMVEDQEIENSMNRAIENEEFEVYLQPQYLLNTETISGAEALIRWNHPDKGLLSPGRFIPIFENNGFIVKLDYYVYEHVCRKLREWLDEGKPMISIAINMSRHHIMEERFVKNLVDIANKYKIQTSSLEIELTENIFFENQDAIVSVMSQLKEAGFKLSMDDFGSGYSSLNLLTEIPVDVIKIDKEFFKAFETNIKSKKVVSMVIKLVRDLKMKVIAEGVETIEQVLFLKAIECDIVQGYYFAKPMPLSQFEKLAFGNNGNIVQDENIKEESIQETTVIK